MSTRAMPARPSTSPRRVERSSRLPASQTFGNLLVASNAWISLSNQPATVTVTGNATIQAGGGIIADGAGYAGGQGTGAGRYDTSAYTGGGGGYGGYGAAGGGTTAYGGSTYGSVTAPTDFGSGGGSYSLMAWVAPEAEPSV